MSNTIIDGTQIDTSVFSYSAPKAYAKGGKVVNLYNKFSRESLTLATPLILTWGAQEGKDQEGNLTGKYSMALQFPTSEYSNDDLDAFLNSMKDLEQSIKESAMEYSKEWFGKKITSSEVMDEKFNVMLRHPKVKGTQEFDLNKPPTLNVKVPCWNGVWQSEIYDEDGEPLYLKGKQAEGEEVTPLDLLKSKTQVICLIQCGGLWFVNGKVSITWNLKQAIVQKPKFQSEGTCLLKIKSSDKEKIQQQSQAEEEEIDDDPDAVSSTIIEDSDEEEEDVKEEDTTVDETPVDETPVEEPEPEVEPVVKKKRILKKKTTK